MRLITPRRAYVAALIVAITIPVAMISWKLLGHGYSLEALMPTVSYEVDINMQVHGHGDDIEISTFLPVSDQRQQVTAETNASGVFPFSVETSELNRRGVWKAENVQGPQSVHYTYWVQGAETQYILPDDLSIPRAYPAEIQRYLKEEDGIQVNDPLIRQTLREIIGDAQPTVAEALTAIHRYLQDNLTNKDFTGFTDALTALKLQEASCNGKGRLFVALARQMNLPARLVGGLVLNPGSKRTSHQWVEVYVNGYWVPFDTINDHFAVLPANFVTLYYGDEVLFRHTTNVNFQYFFKIAKKLVPKQDTEDKLNDTRFNLTNIYGIFEKIGISQNLLKIILMIPFGALVVVIARNVIGLQTFGTFLPALIAAAARETGLLWGIFGFVIIIIISAAVRKFLDWLQLLHSPKMAIMLSFVVVIMLTLTSIGVNMDLFDFAHITLFPIAILAITAERFAIIEVEEGLKKALQITATTLFVIAAAYGLMDSLFLQTIVLAFPELLLLVIALNLWLGKWVGMRLTEFWRFRRLIFDKASA